MNNPSNRSKRLAFIISGILDALIGAALLLIGFRQLPIDATAYGVENWHVNLLGTVLFVLGLGIFAYHLSRLEE